MNVIAFIWFAVIIALLVFWVPFAMVLITISNHC